MGAQKMFEPCKCFVGPLGEGKRIALRVQDVWQTGVPRQKRLLLGKIIAKPKAVGQQRQTAKRGSEPCGAPIRTCNFIDICKL